MRAQPAAADAEKFINEGKVHFFRGHKAQAQMAFARALDADRDDKEARALFVDAVASQGFQNFNPLMKRAIAICLDDPDLMQLWLFFPWYTTLMLDPETQTLASLQGFEDYEALAAELSEFDYSESLNDEFFLAGLCKLLVKDYKFERLLTGLRRYALMHEDEREAILPFLTALAAQCFFNEYIFYVASEEQVVIDELRARQDALSAEEIVMLGCYVPLYALRNADKLAAALRESAEMLVKLQ